MTILVTGARGNIGARLVAGLAAAGHPVLGSARDPRGLALPPGASARELDITAPGDALRGVEAAFLYPAREGVGAFVEAAVAAGVRYVVLLSSPAAFEASEHSGPIGRVHRAAERAVRESGIPATVLYPTWLATNVLRDWAGAIRTSGRVRLAHPDAEFAPVHPGDIAAVAADLLTRETHRALFQIASGPASLRQRDIAHTVGEVLGTPVEVAALSPQEALAARPPHLPEDVFRALTAAEAAAVGVPSLVTNTVARVTGRPARDFRTWARENRDRLLNPEPGPGT
ncbi:NAD(P)H-binding protein [Streptomyces sp. NPDC050560]|uniref:NAD(P)H-binding protein n=1 Tax=Streptomyces sp. NPDC050560 TaxID=3365630 RepID=UPI0037B5C67E